MAKDLTPLCLIFLFYNLWLFWRVSEGRNVHCTYSGQQQVFSTWASLSLVSFWKLGSQTNFIIWALSVDFQSCVELKKIKVTSVDLSPEMKAPIRASKALMSVRGLLIRWKESGSGTWALTVTRETGRGPSQNLQGQLCYTERGTRLTEPPHSLRVLPWWQMW